MKAQLLQFGIHLPQFIGYVVACAISWFAADPIIHWRYKQLFHQLTNDPNKTGKQHEADKAKLASILELKFGKRIGRIERLIYIYAVMLNQFTLLSAWVVLKAFYGWLEKPALAKAFPNDDSKHATLYYAYIYGNGLSLLTALVLAHLGFIVQNAMNLAIP